MLFRLRCQRLQCLHMEDLDAPASCRCWYAVQTRSWTEKVVRDHLRDEGIETFLPLLSKISQWKGRQKRIEWPLFPGYCFARFAVSDKLKVVQAPGVVEIIGSAAGRPEAIPDDEIIALQRVIQSGATYAAHPTLKEGMGVEIIRGPLIGMRGTLLKKDNRSRIIVAVNLICQGAAVEIEADDIAPLA